MSVHEIPSPKLKVDPNILERGLYFLLNEIMVDRNIVVDVNVRDTTSGENEWRVCVPPREPEIYRAISNILSYKDAVYSEHIQRGAMAPREFVVNVWCRRNGESSILGSFD